MGKELFETVDAQYVMDHMGKMPIVDVRPADAYEEGHIPGAQSIPLMDIVEKSDGFYDEAALQFEEYFRNFGIMPEDDVIIYCQTGHHAVLACILLSAVGYSGLHCYKGSFNDWTSDPSRPVEK